MARPKKGEKGYAEANAKWKRTMLERYGKEGWRALMQKAGRAGGSMSSGGGFASDIVGKDGLTGRERSRIAGQKGGKISKRGYNVIKEGKKIKYVSQKTGRTLRKKKGER